MQYICQFQKTSSDQFDKIMYSYNLKEEKKYNYLVIPEQKKF